jgi:DNA-binding MarR family transcriptional regulator
MKAVATSSSAAVTELVLEVFRLNGCLITSGDALVAKIGLTSARWQVLGAIAMQSNPSPVVRIAETIGLTRQSVQRTVDVLEQEGNVAFCANPHHRRAKLVALTAKGTALYRSAMRLQKPWAAKLAVSVDGASLKATLHTLKTLRARLEELGKSGDRQ